MCEACKMTFQGHERRGHHNCWDGTRYFPLLVSQKSSSVLPFCFALLIWRKAPAGTRRFHDDEYLY